MYQVGYELGRHWVIRDATPEQLLRVGQLQPGKDWISTHADPAREFTRVVDPAKSEFMGIEDIPSPSFVAGFIDGAKSKAAQHRHSVLEA